MSALQTSGPTASAHFVAAWTYILSDDDEYQHVLNPFFSLHNINRVWNKKNASPQEQAKKSRRDCLEDAMILSVKPDTRRIHLYTVRLKRNPGFSGIKCDYVS